MTRNRRGTPFRTLVSFKHLYAMAAADAFTSGRRAAGVALPSPAVAAEEREREEPSDREEDAGKRLRAGLESKDVSGGCGL
jgi:hypothetical protein